MPKQITPEPGDIWRLVDHGDIDLFDKLVVGVLDDRVYFTYGGNPNIAWTRSLFEWMKPNNELIYRPKVKMPPVPIPPIQVGDVICCSEFINRSDAEDFYRLVCGECEEYYYAIALCPERVWVEEIRIKKGIKHFHEIIHRPD